ncbi:glycosyltransferase family 2 protein [Fonticella tunisiensis]|uniref:Glycosyl transferase family 2 n=1 Tax=Fonticella tunisiensis TaxID=1096341 RepID=A0A4R7KRW0_9CLOT|nr:glycosyltransferase family A protein [Fonticella tunisiensis]TDT62335.1 glycosyl transferase family 2 [Fonticella tunisiensis]
MIYVIIPCYNEGRFIKEILKEVSKSDADKILVVDNGSTDNTLDILKSFESHKINILYCNTPLGHDVPRAVGLSYALSDGGEYFIFIDGDMLGITKDDINTLIKSLKLGVDLSLTDCYYDNELPSGLAYYVLEFRKMLNMELNLFDKIKYSTPSHGPHGISKRLAESIPIHYISIPPLLLCWAVKMGFTVDVGLNKLHRFLSLMSRTEKHALKMAETIIGDCICGINYVKNNTLSRVYEDIEYTGYHKDRRFDLLDIMLNDAALKA